MTIERIPVPINSSPYLGSESAANNLNSGVFFNGYIDGNSKKRSRPGFELWKDLGTIDPIDGLFWSETIQKLFAISSGNIYKIDSDKTQTNLSGTVLGTALPVIATEDNLRAFFANGGRIKQTNGSDNVVDITDGNAPTKATHVVFFNNAIFANDVNNAVSKRRVLFSDIGDSLTWSDNFVTAEAHPDEVVAIHTIAEQLVVFGKQTTEFFRAVANSLSPVARTHSIKIGTESPYSITEFSDSLIFMDNNKHIRQLVGTQISYISVPKLDEELQKLGNVSTARGFIKITDKGPFYVITFPDDEKSWAYSLITESWSEWSFWDVDLVRNTIYLGQNAVNLTNKNYNVSIIGSRIDGKIYSTSKENKDDNEIVEPTDGPEDSKTESSDGDQSSNRPSDSDSGTEK